MTPTITAVRELIAIAFSSDVAAMAPEVAALLRQQSTQHHGARREALEATAAALVADIAALSLDVGHQVRARFDGKLAPGGDPLSKTARIASGSFAIGEEAQMRLEISLDTCAARLREQSGEEIVALTKRLAEILGREGIAELDNPVVPRTFVRALADSLAGLGLDAQGQLDAFQAFGPALLHIASDLYTLANALLADYDAAFGAQSPQFDERTLSRLRSRLMSGAGVTTLDLPKQ